MVVAEVYGDQEHYPLDDKSKKKNRRKKRRKKKIRKTLILKM